MRLHGFGHFYIQCFAGSTYGFPFRIDEFEWYELDVCEFVSILVEMLWYRIGGLVLYASTVFSESVTQRPLCLSNIVFSNDLVEGRRGWIVSNYKEDTLVVFLVCHAWLQGVVSWNSFCLVYFMLNLFLFITPFLQMFREFITTFVKCRVI